MNTNQIVKTIIGIDVGSKLFYACYKVKLTNGKVLIKGTKAFENTTKGIAEFYQWFKKRSKPTDVKPIFVMEATGVYYENLAYYLDEREEAVSVQLAQKVKYFAKGCNLKTKTDKVDAKMIAEFGIEKDLANNGLWTPPSKEFKLVRDLTREHTSLVGDRTRAKSQIHALERSFVSNSNVVDLKEKQVEFYNKQIKTIEEEIRRIVKQDKELYSKIQNIETIKGLGFMTIMKVVTETNGFLLFSSIRQLVSYAGLDIIEHESGTIVGKTRISKKGNARIRSALYMPAMAAVRSNSTLKVFYERLNQGKRVKKQGLIAVMRKLLILIYTLWKKNEKFIENHQVSS